MVITFATPARPNPNSPKDRMVRGIWTKDVSTNRFVWRGIHESLLGKGLALNLTLTPNNLPF